MALNPRLPHLLWCVPTRLRLAPRIQGNFLHNTRKDHGLRYTIPQRPNLGHSRQAISELPSPPRLAGLGILHSMTRRWVLCRHARRSDRDARNYVRLQAKKHLPRSSSICIYLICVADSRIPCSLLRRHQHGERMDGSPAAVGPSASSSARPAPQASPCL